MVKDGEKIIAKRGRDGGDLPPSSTIIFASCHILTLNSAERHFQIDQSNDLSTKTYKNKNKNDKDKDRAKTEDKKIRKVERNVDGVDSVEGLEDATRGGGLRRPSSPSSTSQVRLQQHIHHFVSSKSTFFSTTTLTNNSYVVSTPCCSHVSTLVI